MKTALTLTRSRPTGEGTAFAPQLLLGPAVGKSRARILELRGERFSLSHRMGEGWGGGKFSD